MFRQGHAARIGIARRRLIPIGTPRRLARWLIARYGIAGAAQVAGLRRGTLESIAYARKQRSTTPWLAQRLAEAVLAHRVSAAPWDVWQALSAKERTILRPVTPPPKRGGSLVPWEELSELVDELLRAYGGLRPAARALAACGGGSEETWERWLARVLERQRVGVLRGVSESKVRVLMAALGR